MWLLHGMKSVLAELCDSAGVTTAGGSRDPLLSNRACVMGSVSLADNWWLAESSFWGW